MLGQLQQPSASFAAKAALDTDSDEDPIKPATINNTSSAVNGHNAAAHDAEQRQQQQQMPGGSGTAASASAWLPHDVRMVMRTHAYPADYLEAISPRHLPPDKVGLCLSAVAVLLRCRCTVSRTSVRLTCVYMFNTTRSRLTMHV
jgi:hypothetical protein